MAFFFSTQVHSVRVHDTSSKRKTAENLLRVLMEVKEELERDWGCVIVAITSDASGES
jgi:hypothetical protein